MRGADDMKQVSLDNVDPAKVVNEVNRIENELFARAKGGHRDALITTSFVLSEKVFAALEEAGYAMKVKKKSILKGVLIEVTW